MACVTTTATNSVIKLRELSRNLSLIRSSNWWDYPNLYRITNPSNNTWEFTDPRDNENGALTVFQFTSRPDYILFTQGYQFAKDVITQAIAELDLVTANLYRSGGDIKFKRETIDTLASKVLANKDRLTEIRDSNFLDVRYGGRSTIPVITFVDFLSLAQGLEIFAIVSPELAELKYTASVIGRASDDLISIVEILSYGDCTDNEDDNDDNCDRIADALEAIAAKDFNCGDNVETDLAELLTLVNQVKDSVGSSELIEGIRVPKSITDVPPKGKENDDKYYVTINTLIDFNTWHFKQLDALMGRFPLTIKQGNDTISIPNVSEGLAELYAMGAIELVNSNAILRGVVSATGESIQIKKMVYQCKIILDNLQEFACLTVKDKKVKMPVSVDLTKNKVEDYLKSTEADVIIDDYQPNTDGSEFDIDRIGKIVNTVYAILSTAFVHRIDRDNPNQSFKEDLQQLRDGMSLIDDEDEDGFTSYLERVELGFTDSPLSGDNLNPQPSGVKPYGRDLNRRPLIKRTEGMGQDDIDEDDTTEGDNP